MKTYYSKTLGGHTKPMHQLSLLFGIRCEDYEGAELYAFLSRNAHQIGSQNVNAYSASHKQYFISLHGIEAALEITTCDDNFPKINVITSDPQNLCKITNNLLKQFSWLSQKKSRKLRVKKHN